MLCGNSASRIGRRAWPSLRFAVSTTRAAAAGRTKNIGGPSPPAPPVPAPAPPPPPPLAPMPVSLPAMPVPPGAVGLSAPPAPPAIRFRLPSIAPQPAPPSASAGPASTMATRTSAVLARRRAASRTQHGFSASAKRANLTKSPQPNRNLSRSAPASHETPFTSVVGGAVLRTCRNARVHRLRTQSPNVTDAEPQRSPFGLAYPLPEHSILPQRQVAAIAYRTQESVPSWCSSRRTTAPPFQELCAGRRSRSQARGDNATINPRSRNLSYSLPVPPDQGGLSRGIVRPDRRAVSVLNSRRGLEWRRGLVRAKPGLARP